MQHTDMHLLWASGKISKTLNVTELELLNEFDALRPSKKVHSIENYLSISSRTSATEINGFRTCWCKLCCNSGKHRFHWVAQTTWITPGSPNWTARFNINSRFFINFSWAYIDKEIISTTAFNKLNFLHVPPNFNLRTVFSRKQSLSQQTLETFCLIIPPIIFCFVNRHQ